MEKLEALNSDIWSLIISAADRPTLKSLRQVNKQLHGLSTPELLSEINVHAERPESSVQNSLVLLQHTQQYAHHVRKLSIFGMDTSQLMNSQAKDYGDLRKLCASVQHQITHLEINTAPNDLFISFLGVVFACEWTKLSTLELVNYTTTGDAFAENMTKLCPTLKCLIIRDLRIHHFYIDDHSTSSFIGTFWHLAENLTLEHFEMHGTLRDSYGGYLDVWVADPQNMNPSSLLYRWQEYVCRRGPCPCAQDNEDWKFNRKRFKSASTPSSNDGDDDDGEGQQLTQGSVLELSAIMGDTEAADLGKAPWSDGSWKFVERSTDRDRTFSNPPRDY